MKVYTNSDNEIVSMVYKEGLNEVDIPAENPDDLFYGKCHAYIMGFRAGMEECGEEEDGTPIMGFVIAPYKDLAMLEMAQQQYEHFQEMIAEISIPPSIMLAATFTAETFADEQALQVKELYPAWGDFIGKELKAGKHVRYGEKLWKVKQNISVVLENQPPSIDTAALYEEIVENHEGTIDDPIPYNNNMELFEGKYYTQDGVVYECTRNTEQAVYQTLADLVGIYVEIAE